MQKLVTTRVRLLFVPLLVFGISFGAAMRVGTTVQGSTPAPTSVEEATSAKRMNDHEIRMALERALIVDPAVPSARIDVEVKDGIALLEGSVGNALARDRAVQVAGTVRGVLSVVNRVEVETPATLDAKLATRVETALLEDPATDSYEVDITASDGMVTITGTVDSWAEKRLCGTVAKGVRGVRDVRNEVTVNYQGDRSPLEICSEIEERLAHDVWIDDYLAEVQVADDTVLLEGTVGSDAERARAKRLAWVAGVADVDATGLEVEAWAVKGKQRRPGEANMTDAEIEEAVRKALLHDPRVFSFNPEVRVQNGIVTLTGSVDNLMAKYAAERDARNTVGVWHVKNYLSVRPVVPVADQELEKKIEEALARDAYLNRFDLAMNVVNGTVYLYGKVDSRFERARAEDVLARVGGVVDVVNLVDVAPTWSMMDDLEIREQIEDELFWSTRVDVADVEIEVRGGVAVLRGTVDTWTERRAATENALEGGATRVINELDVKYGPASTTP